MSKVNYDLLKGKLPEISKLVNSFKSESLQKYVFSALLTSILPDDTDITLEVDASHDIKIPDEKLLGKKIKRIAQEGDGSAKPVTKKIKGKYTPSIVKDLNLRPSGKKSLKEFTDEISPKDNQQRYAVIVYYYKKILGLDKVGLNHIYTAFKAIGKPVPNNISGGIIVTAARKGWIDTHRLDNIKLTIAGENFIEHELPKKKPVKGK